jgi:hypothetical protein
MIAPQEIADTEPAATTAVGAGVDD